MPEDLRVAHVMGELRPSGMERMLVSAAPYFRQLGVEPVVIGQGDEHPFAEAMTESGLSVSTPPAGISRGEWLGTILRRTEPDVVHLHPEGHWAETVLRTRRSVRRAPMVRTVHSVFDAHGRWWLSRRLQGVVGDRFVQQFVAPSPDVALNERRFGRDLRVILNWVDDRYHDPESRGPDSMSGLDPLAVVVGNCSEIKNHELALSVLLDGGFRIAHLGAEGGASSRETALLDEADRSGRLAFRGVADPLPWLRRADLFALPSRVEGMGVALAEAIAMGVPCLVNDVPGVSWARSAPGVELAGTTTAWQTAARRLRTSPSRDDGAAVPDLTAQRGAREYTDVYRHALG